jgi:hypothetical protein
MNHCMLGVLSLLFLLTNGMFAQDSLKTAHGKWTTELNVNPFQGEISFNNAINQVKLRHFVTDQLAYRYAFTLNALKTDDKQNNPYGYNPVDDHLTQKSFLIAVNLGFERHFTGTSRLSPYLGGEIALGYKRSSQRSETTDLITTVEGSWYTSNFYYNGNYYRLIEEYDERGFISAGVNAIAGFDFYFSEHFYFGYEMLFSLNYIDYTKVEFTSKLKPGSTSTLPTYPTMDGSELFFGPKLLNGIRLGFTF